MVRTSRLLGLAMLAGFSSADAQRSTIARDAFRARADSLVFTYLAESRAPSAAFAVIRGKDTLAYGAHGLANVEAWRAPTATTIYEIGSITKQFTSAAIMKLVEQGKVKLDDDLSKFVPQFPLQGKKVSIRQLLNHTSGIHSYTSSPNWQKTWNDALTPDAIVKFVAADTFDFAPGTAYRYNNTGYVLLGMVIEKASGQTYAKYLDAQFFKPLGLKQTSYCPSKTSDPTFALGYSKAPNGAVGVARATFMDLSHPFSAGALCSTIGDFVKWQRALDGGKVVSPASYALMTTADSLNSGRKINYGFGLVPGMFSGHKTVSHTGGIPGFATAATYVPDDSLSIVVYTNFDGESPQALVQNLLRVAYGEAPVARRAPGAPAPAPSSAPTLSTADRDAIVGNYALQIPGGQTLPIKFSLDGTRLMAQAQGQEANEVRYLGNYEFGVAFDPALRFTFTMVAGKATKVTLLQGGARIEGPRVPEDRVVPRSDTGFPPFLAVASGMDKVIQHTRLDELRPENSHGFTIAEVHDIMDGIYARGDRLMQGFLASHLVLALALAFFHQTWAATLLVGLGACGSFALCARLWPRSFFTRAYAGVAQQAFVALHIYQLNGQAEQHFWYFTAFTMMIVYQDWLCMWPGALLIILQHSIFAGLHNAGLPVHFFPEEHVGFTKLFFHFGIALVHVSLCGYWAHLLRRQTLGDSWQRLLLNRDRSLLELQLEQLKKSESALTAQSAELARVSRQHRAILDNSADSMWVKGLDGRYVAVNSPFARHVGASMADIEGATPDDFFAPDDLELIREQDQQVIVRRAPVVAERQVLLAGARRIVEVTVMPILDVEGELTGTTGVARDVTDRRREESERKRSEARDQHAQKLESLGLLAGGIAHDFNNLLLGILANAEMTRDELPQGSPALDSCDQIVESAQRAAELTRQMLAYAGKGRVEVRRLDLSVEVEGTLDLLRSAISKKARLHLELSPALPVVEADASQIRQVLMNLITNASDALGDGDGVIALRTRALDVKAGDIRLPLNQEELVAGRYVVLEVSDNGAGMDADTVARIFDPFFTTKFVGRGLGLSAVLGILRSHRGGVEIESAPKRGSTFRVYLPALAQAAAIESAPAIPTTSNAHSNGTGLVVVVDDEPTVRRLAATILTRAGYQVISAGDGIEALQVIEKHSADVSVVLLDMLMPRMDGGETLRELRRRYPAMPVLLNSGYSAEVAAEQLLTDALVGFVQKPYDSGKLLAAIGSWLARQFDNAADTFHQFRPASNILAKSQMTYQPDLYDVVTPSALQGDVEWYCAQARASGGPVLELGAGTGRVTLAIAADGTAIHALDSDQGMLRALQSKLAERAPEVQARVTAVQGDMRTFDLGERFALIICPFRGFLHNVTESDQLACLTRVREHLRPGGRFAFNVFHPSLTFMAQHAGPLAGVWRWGETRTLPSGGWVVQSDANRYDTVRHVVHSMHRYDVYGPEGRLERSSMLRLELAYLYPADIRRLLAAAGFRDVVIKGGFDGRQFSRDGEELVVEAA